MRGYVRRFWQASPDHRGTPEAMGRVVTLVPLPGIRHSSRQSRHAVVTSFDSGTSTIDPAEAPDDTITHGTVFRIPAEQAPGVIEKLCVREAAGYCCLWLEVQCDDGETRKALTFTATPENEYWVGPKHWARRRRRRPSDSARSASDDSDVSARNAAPHDDAAYPKSHPSRQMTRDGLPPRAPASKPFSSVVRRSSLVDSLDVTSHSNCGSGVDDASACSVASASTLTLTSLHAGAPSSICGGDNGSEIDVSSAAGTPTSSSISLGRLSGASLGMSLLRLADDEAHNSADRAPAAEAAVGETIDCSGCNGHSVSDEEVEACSGCEECCSPGREANCIITGAQLRSLARADHSVPYLARVIATSAGRAGPNIEYLSRLRDAMLARGVADPHLEALWAAIQLESPFRRASGLEPLARRSSASPVGRALFSVGGDAFEFTGGASPSKAAS